MRISSREELSGTERSNPNGGLLGRLVLGGNQAYFSSLRRGTIGAGRLGWMRFLPGGGESKWVTTTSPPGFSGTLVEDGGGGSSGFLSGGG